MISKTKLLRYTLGRYLMKRRKLRELSGTLGYSYKALPQDLSGRKSGTRKDWLLEQELLSRVKETAVHGRIRL